MNTSSVDVQVVCPHTASSKDMQGVSFSTFVHFFMPEHRTVWHLIIPESE
jgi:hypothetical protein